MHLFCDAWRCNFNLFERFEVEIKLCKHNQKEVKSVHYIRVYAKGVLKNVCLCRNFRRENNLSIMFKAIDSPERLWSKTHPRYFTFSYCLISIPLYTMFKALVFQSLCLVPNKTDFVLSWPKCTLNLLSINQSHKLEKSLSSCFSISVTFLCWKTMRQGFWIIVCIGGWIWLNFQWLGEL